MAKGNIKIIKHDDHDIKYFIGLLGVNELKRIFLNEDGTVKDKVYYIVPDLQKEIKTIINLLKANKI